MALSNNPFRGGNIVHRIELPRLRRPAGRRASGPVRPAGEPTRATVSPDPAGPPDPNGSPYANGPTARSGPAAATRGFAPDPAPPGPRPRHEAEQGAINVEFEVLSGSRVGGATLTRAQERQVELELALEEESSNRESLEATHRQEVEFLERRLTKLRSLVEAQEVDLRRAVAEGQIDSGWASCYRGVQGLDMTAPDAELKREMLAQIFQANRSLQARIASLGV